MGTQGFKRLLIWQKAKDLAVLVYRISEKSELSRDYSLRDQLRRSAISVASNIAEGEERHTDKESVQFFYIAKGSLAELRTQLQIASEAGLLEKPATDRLDADCEILGKMIGSLIQARMRSSCPAPRALSLAAG